MCKNRYREQHHTYVAKDRKGPFSCGVAIYDLWQQYTRYWSWRGRSKDWKKSATDKGQYVFHFFRAILDMTRKNNTNKIKAALETNETPKKYLWETWGPWNFARCLHKNVGDLNSSSHVPHTRLPGGYFRANGVLWSSMWSSRVCLATNRFKHCLHWKLCVLWVLSWRWRARSDANSFSQCWHGNCETPDCPAYTHEE